MVDWVPGLSQMKSLGQVICGDVEGARRTQDNFSKQCPVVSQYRSALEAIFVSGEAALETQMEFLRGFLRIGGLKVRPVATPKEIHNTEKSQEKMRAEAREKLGMNVVNHINYAFVGQSGAGKSSIINALRGIGDKDEDAAEVGETEKTMLIKKFCYPGYPYIMLWDIPGAGTLAHPERTYFEDKMLYAFDCILIVSSSRFMELDYKIASKAHAFQTPCAFVRTKADDAVKSKAMRNPGMTMEEVGRIFKEEVRDSFARDLAAAPGLPRTVIHKLFTVSAWGFDKRSEAYVFCRRDRTFDESLKGMDEQALSHFLCDVIRCRV